jgi:hypothetical protein
MKKLSIKVIWQSHHTHYHSIQLQIKYLKKCTLKYSLNSLQHSRTYAMVVLSPKTLSHGRSYSGHDINVSLYRAAAPVAGSINYR